jgi:hypothetical protein
MDSGGAPDGCISACERGGVFEEAGIGAVGSGGRSRDAIGSLGYGEGGRRAQWCTCVGFASSDVTLSCVFISHLIYTTSLLLSAEMCLLA